MTQEPPKLLMEVLAHPLQIFTEQMLIVITYQMLSVAVESNHDDQPRPALHNISLKWYKSLVLKWCFRPAPNEHRDQQLLGTASLLLTGGLTPLLSWGPLE